MGLAGRRERRSATQLRLATLSKPILAKPIASATRWTAKRKLAKSRRGVVEQLAGGDAAAYAGDDVADMFGKVEKDLVRQRVLNGEPRIDGRDLRTVRPIEVEVGVLPKAHGSALFTRGETQALVVATLGTLRDAAMIDALGRILQRYLHAALQLPSIQCW